MLKTAVCWIGRIPITGAISRSSIARNWKRPPATAIAPRHGPSTIVHRWTDKAITDFAMADVSRENGAGART